MRKEYEVYEGSAIRHNLTNFSRPSDMAGARGGTVVRGTELQTGRQRVRFPTVSLELFIDIILPATLWP